MMNKIVNLMVVFLLLSISLTVSALDSPTRASLKLEQQKSKLQLSIKDNQISINVLRENKKIIALNAIHFNETSALAWRLENQSADVLTLIGEFPSHVDFYRVVTDEQPRTVKLNISKSGAGFRIFAEPTWGRTTSLEFAYLGDHFFGLSEPLQPNNQLSPDLTGSSIAVDINSEDAALHENYATAYSAFYISSFGYGAFFDSFARGRYDFSINNKNRIAHDTGKLDWYIFPGADGVEIQRAYFALTGAPKKVPAWGLGPMGWRDQNNGGAAEILADVKKMRELKIPFTSWFVDRPYSDGAHAWSQMNFNAQFADPAQWIKQLRDAEGVEFMTWTATATFGDNSVGKHLGGKFSYLDLSDPASVKIFQNNLQQKQHVFGVKGHKIDRADEAFPVTEDWVDTAIPLANRRNYYSVLMAKVHDEALRQHWGDDQMTFARSAYHRSHTYLSAIWGGDPRTSWEGLQGNFANAMRASFMGFPVWGTDVGGYQGEGYIPEDLYIRWMQAGSMTGLFEIKLDGAGGAGRDRMPWRYDEKFQQWFRAICEERMAFIPYLYSLANTSASTGVLMQPLAYRHLQDKNTYAIADQFYLGNAILVAPVMQPGERRKLYLPQGNWVDFNNPAKRYKGGKFIEVNAPLDILPRFIAENSLFVKGNIAKGNDRFWNVQKPTLTIVANPAAKNGESQFMYVDMLDRDRPKAIAMQREKNNIRLQVPAFNHAVELILLLENSPAQVQINGKSVEGHFDAERDEYLLPLAAGEDAKVDIRL